MNPLSLRIGLGQDTHRLREGGQLWLGGVEIPHTHSLVGHSDADVLLHAVTDALLGAAGMGDIGTWFPNDDPANRGRASGEMLAEVAREIAQAGYQIIQLDCVVQAQRPKLAKHREAICQRIGELLNLPPQRVGFKAKTGEEVGPVGRCEAMEAHCVALLYHESAGAIG